MKRLLFVATILAGIGGHAFAQGAPQGAATVNSTTNGYVPSGWTTLAPSTTNGYVLSSQGSGQPLAWIANTVGGTGAYSPNAPYTGSTANLIAAYHFDSSGANVP